MRHSYTAGDTGHLEDHGNIGAHVDAVVNVHGITNTALLVVTSDSRLSDSRPPTSHAASHASGGSDPLDLSGIADPPGTAAGLVDDLSGVSNASQARTNLGLGSLATLSTITSSNITDGTIVGGDISGSAAIAYSKLNLAASIVNSDIAAAAGIPYSKLSLSGTITNADLAGSINANKITTGTLTGVTIDNGNTVTLKDSLFTLQDGGDTTKQVVFELSGITTGTTRTWTVPNVTDTFVGRDQVQTLTNKTIVTFSSATSGMSARIDANGNGLTAISASNSFLGLDFIGTEFNGVGSKLDLRSTQGTSLTSLSPSLQGDVLGGIHIGGSHNNATGLTDCAQIFNVCTENFSTDATASGNRWAIYTTSNLTETKQVALTIDHDGEMIAGSPDALGTASATRTYAASTAKPEAFFGTKSTQTVISSFSTPTLPSFARHRATMKINAAFSGSSFYQGGFVNQPIITNDVTNGTGDWGTTAVTASAFGFRDIATLTIDTQTGACMGLYRSFHANPTFNRANSGTFTSGGVNLMATAPVVGAGVTVTALTHYAITDVSNSGTVTTQIGVDIPQLANGTTTNIGLKNAGATVYPPKTKAITAVGDSLSTADIQATNIRLNNTSGSSKTLTSAPQIADGIQDGQVIILTNTSANDIVFSDQGTVASSNLRLVTSTITLSTRDNVTLKYDGTIGDWIQITSVVNII
jgi:hypothetical protein